MTLPPSPNLPTIVATYRWMRTPFEFMEECHEKLGDAFSLHLPGLPRIAIFSEPDVVKHVFADSGEDLLAGEFNKSLSRDRTRITVNGFTQLGLVEMTRKRTRESLEHVLCSECPECKEIGRAHV